MFMYLSPNILRRKLVNKYIIEKKLEVVKAEKPTGIISLGIESAIFHCISSL